MLEECEAGEMKHMWSICHFPLEFSHVLLYLLTSVLYLLKDKPIDRDYVYLIHATETPDTGRYLFFYYDT